jgi:type III secretory pathway lipoprotein EscJ
MIQHVVMWKLVATESEERAEIVEQMVSRLGALMGQIPGLISIRVTADLRELDSNYDVCLISVHESHSALDDYRIHPAHKEFAEWLSPKVADRASVDSEI